MANGVINSSSFKASILPEGQIGFDKAIAEYPSLVGQLFEERTMDRAYLRWTKTYGLSVAAPLGEAESVSNDVMGQLWYKLIVAQKYGKGVMITQEAIENDRAGIIYQMKGRELGKIVGRTRDLNAAAFFDGAFTSGNISDTGDGVALFSNAHPLKNGTFSNIPSSYVAFSEDALEQAYEDISLNFVNEMGFAEMVKPVKLHIGVTNALEATRVLKSVGQVYTPDNTPNALRSMGLFGGDPIVNPLLVNQNSYYVITDVADGLCHYTRNAPVITSDNEFANDVMKFKVIFKETFCALDPRCAYGVYIA